MDLLQLDQLAKQYRIEEMGYIATGYVKEQEEAVYLAASEILANQYPNLININEVYKILSGKGNIFTVYKYRGDRRNGLFDGKRGHILIPYFIKKMSENLLHELTHKLGFVRADKSFLEMNPDVRENGTEIVASSSLSIGKARSSILPYVWGIYPEKASSDLLTYPLSNQMNKLIGGESLEKSVLKGHDYFKDAIEEKYGNNFYNYFSSQITYFTQKKCNYYNMVDELGTDNEKIMKLGKEFFAEIKQFEDDILKQEFDRRFSQINSLEAAKKFLNELNSFGEFRFQHQNSDGIFEDENLENIFNEYKAELEKKYGNINVAFKKVDIESFKVIEFEEDLEPGELDRIEQMAIDFEKASKKRLKEAKRSKIRGLFGKIFGIPNSDNALKQLPQPQNTSETDFNESLIAPNINSAFDENIKFDKNKREERQKVD